MEALLGFLGGVGFTITVGFILLVAGAWGSINK